jgi:dipeptidase
MCDTFVATAAATADGHILFCKNSDREPNEAQALEWFPPREHPPGAWLRCTYRRIPQARATRGVLVSRPFWMWGAEMGANDAGLVMGNEAVWTRMPVNRGEGLTGMDLLRLALERAATAAQAVEVLAGLLHDHGQGGVCGWRNRRMVYHNSFLMADPAEAWVMETAGPLWAARRVQGTYAISNALTIAGEFDCAHPDLIATARRRGWLARRRDFDFARCYGDPLMALLAGARPRRRRALARLEEAAPGLDAALAMGLLRDHGELPYRPDRHLRGSRVCAHAGYPLLRDATQTTASLVAHLAPAQPVAWVTAAAAPCLGVFKPVSLTAPHLPNLGPPPGARYRAEAYWWRQERDHRRALADLATVTAALAPLQARAEAHLGRQVAAAAGNLPSGLTAGAFAAGDACRAAIADTLAAVERRPRVNPVFRGYWRRRNREAGVETAWA